MLAKIRRMHFRDHLSLHEIARRTGLSRNTVRAWLRRPQVTEPRYPKRLSPSKLDAYKETLTGWLKADRHRNKRERRTARQMYVELRRLGYGGGYGRVSVFARRWRQEQSDHGHGQAFVPLRFALGEAFQFDWSTEYAFVGGLRRRLEVAHVKLCASRAFLVVAYYSQAHEMLFDAHARAFEAFGGLPRRGIYDNMKTAVDRVLAGKERIVNARFEAMTGHYLFEAQFCNVASGWEKGVVEKNVQDRRRQLWRLADEQRWSDLATLNRWLAEQCRSIWSSSAHADWPQLTIAEVLRDEQMQLMPNPKPFDGYVESPARVSSTSLIHLQRNRYSVPTEHANRVVSVRLYPELIDIVADGVRVARHVRSFERDQTFYDWQHYIGLIERKPGALRNGAPFATMPEPLRRLQAQLLRHAGGDRVMAQVLAAVPIHGLEAVLVATELVLEAGRPSAEHVLNVLARLKPDAAAVAVQCALRLKEEPRADVSRYDGLRGATGETSHVE